ncbi:MAG: hypothetical protein ACTSRP_18175 [Candidatus Helarchaeota archaeon]
MNLNDKSYEFKVCGPINHELMKEFEMDINLIDEFMTEYEINILTTIAFEMYSKRSRVAELSFQGLKTKLGIHQQKLNIALRRLINKNYLEKTLNGYTLTEKGMLFLNKLLKTKFQYNDEYSKKFNEYMGLEFRITINSKQNHLYNRIYLLKGRWFSHWRWIGIFYSPGSIKMEWQSINGNLEACLCINENHFCVAIFDIGSDIKNIDLDLLENELDKFLKKIQNIMEFQFPKNMEGLKYKIITNSTRCRSEISGWIKNYV